MKNKDFEGLVSSIEEAGEIRRGEVAASRTFEFEAADVKEIRQSLELSQSELAMLIGVSVATLQNWEQGRRRPEGPSRALLRIAATNLQAFVDALLVAPPYSG